MENHKKVDLIVGSEIAVQRGSFTRLVGSTEFYFILAKVTEQLIREGVKVHSVMRETFGGNRQEHLAVSKEDEPAVRERVGELVGEIFNALNQQEKEAREEWFAERARRSDKMPVLPSVDDPQQGQPQQQIVGGRKLWSDDQN